MLEQGLQKEGRQGQRGRQKRKLHCAPLSVTQELCWTTGPGVERGWGGGGGGGGGVGVRGWEGAWGMK